MECGIKESILQLGKNSYALENYLPEDQSNFIDCSAGINPLGFSKQINAALKDIPLDIINTYPESNKSIKEAIANYWSNVIELGQDQILLGDGAIGLIYKINKLFIDEKTKVLGYSPQFTDFIDDVKSYGGMYEYYLMNMENNFKFKHDQFLNQMDKSHKLFYLDNPNNPTGQVIDIEFIHEIVKRAKSLGTVVIIDEAYGDFMDTSNSAISLINEYDNLFIIRSFSKGLGLAGIRAGYLITSNRFAKYYQKISNPFEMNGLARYLATVAIKDEKFIEQSITKLSIYKEKFIKSLTKLIVLETNLAVPIMTLKHPDSSVDLEEFLLNHNIITVSGRNFIGLDKSFVRVRLSKDIDSLIKAFEQVEFEM